MYALLYVGSGVLSYVSRKLKLPRNQSVLYVQKSVRIPNTPLTDDYKGVDVHREDDELVHNVLVLVLVLVLVKQ